MTTKKSTLSRIAATVLAALMVIMYCIPASVFADPAKPDKNKATIKIAGVEDAKTEKSVSVKAFHVVEGNFNSDQHESGALIDYKYVKAVEDWNENHKNDPGFKKIELGKDKNNNPIIKKGDIARLANLINSGDIAIPGKAMTLDKNNAGTYTLEVTEPGYYIVTVAGAKGYVYNPAVIGVSYDKDGQLAQGEALTLTTDKVAELGEEEATYVKKSKVTVDKETVKDNDKAPQSDNTSGGSSMAPIADGGMEGATKDNINFKVTTAIPAYNEAVYTNPKFIVKDTLSAGLDFNTTAEKVVVKVGEKGHETAVTPDTNYTVKIEGKNLTVDFKKDFIFAHPNQSVVVEYSAVLNANAVTGFNQNTNDVTVEYSNDPSNDTNVETVEDKNYHYTFEIDGQLDGYNVDKEVTHEVTKTGEEKVTETESLTENKPISGAVFELTRLNNDGTEMYLDANGKVCKKGDEGAKKAVFHATTDEKGHMNFKGLAEGKYKLRETKAPEGYALENKDHPVEISATYLDDGKLDTYTIKIDNKTTATYKGTYSKEGTLTEVTNEVTDATAEIKNSKTPSLPSTGGIGTYIFTIAGIAIIAIAAGMHFRKKKED